MSAIGGMTMNLHAKTESLMKERMEKLRGELSGVRTGRANPQLLDAVKVEYYGALVPLRQVASISVPEARTLQIQPFDPTALEAVEKAIQKSDLGVPPQSDGKVIRLQLPSMTEERRKDLVKVISRIAEDARVAVRNLRRDANEELKKLEKDKKISEDDRKGQENQVQKLTDLYVKRVDEASAEKQKEITTI